MSYEYSVNEKIAAIGIAARLIAAIPGRQPAHQLFRFSAYGCFIFIPRVTRISSHKCAKKSLPCST